MPRRSLTPRRSRAATSIATQTAELAFAVPQVVAHRVTRMALAGASPSLRDRREFQLMGAEKAAAFNESWTAMATQAFAAQQALAMSLLRSMWAPWLFGTPSATAMARQMHAATLGVLDKGLAPVHRKAVANAKRLARSTRR